MNSIDPKFLLDLVILAGGIIVSVVTANLAARHKSAEAERKASAALGHIDVQRQEIHDLTVQVGKLETRLEERTSGRVLIDRRKPGE